MGYDKDESGKKKKIWKPLNFALMITLIPKRKRKFP